MIKEAELDALAESKTGVVLTYLYKTAAFNSKEWGEATKAALPKILAATIGGTAFLMLDRFFIDKMIAYFDKRKADRETVEYFQKMLSSHPKLRDYDPEEVAKYWESLYHFSPMVAKDPLGAGAFIVQSIDRGYSDIGGPPLDVYRALADIQKNYNESKPKAKSIVDTYDRYGKIYTGFGDWQERINNEAKKVLDAKKKGTV